MPHIITCPDCTFQFPFAPSKRVQICPNCKSIEKTGLSLKDIARQKQREWSEKSRLKTAEKQKLKPKNPYLIPQYSKKGAKQAREVAQMKTDVKRANVETEFGECEGCGNFFDTLDCSHVVPLSQSSELAAMPENIRLLCRGCHIKWESMNAVQMIELNCFLPDMRFLLDFDPERFWKIHFRIVDENNKNSTPKLRRVLGELEKLE